MEKSSECGIIELYERKELNNEPFTSREQNRCEKQHRAIGVLCAGDFDGSGVYRHDVHEAQSLSAVDSDVYIYCRSSVGSRHLCTAQDIQHENAVDYSNFGFSSFRCVFVFSGRSQRRHMGDAQAV